MRAPRGTRFGARETIEEETDRTVVKLAADADGGGDVGDRSCCWCWNTVEKEDRLIGIIRPVLCWESREDRHRFGLAAIDERIGSMDERKRIMLME